MKTFLLNIIAFLAQEQLKRLGEDQKKIGISGSSVWVPSKIAQELANSDKRYFKKIFHG